MVYVYMIANIAVINSYGFCVVILFQYFVAVGGCLFLKYMLKLIDVALFICIRVCGYCLEYVHIYIYIYI